MSGLSKNAKEFVTGVVSYIKKEGREGPIHERVRKYLRKVSEQDISDNIVFVDSVVSLTDKEKEQLNKIIQSAVGRPIRSEYRVLPSLMGGIRIKIGELILDTSLKSQLDDLRLTLL
jgi:F-type H+-transporting ATPase subunit delta